MMFAEKPFRDREDAAEKLAPHLQKYAGHSDTLLLAIPRGALQLGAVLRDRLNLPLDIVVTKKIGAPGNEEFAIGSVGPDGKVALNEGVVKLYGIPQKYVSDEAQRLQHVIQRRYSDYRGDRPLPDVAGKTAIVADDGIATGFTVRAAVEYLRRQKAKKIVVAVPVCAADTAAWMKKEADEWICLYEPEDFDAVGQFYKNFPQVEDEEAKRLLAANRQKP